MNSANETTLELDKKMETSGVHKGRAQRWTGVGGVGLVVILLGLLPLLISGSYYMRIMILAFVYVVVSSSFRTISISGQFNIAQGAFMGIGGYAAALSSVWLHWSPWATIPLGAVAATVVSSVLAFPFARLRTIYYAMGTLFLGYVVINLFTAGGKLTGMSIGLAGVRPLFTGSTRYYYLFMGVMIVALACLYRFEFSRLGVTAKAVAQSHQVAASVGINERRTRILVVAFSSFFTGLMGALYVHYQMVAAPNSFGLSATLLIIMYALVGGLYSFWGPGIGVVILLIVPEFFRDLKQYLPYVTAVILLVIAFTMPEGIVGLVKLLGYRISRRLHKGEVSGDASRD